ncbi:MAG: ParB/Srx family N-terminal domain-containing protein [Lacrimispora sphenoides]
MKKIMKKLSELRRPEKNIRIHTEKQLIEFEKSVRMFGQIRPIVIDEDEMILAGNGLYETLIRMGWIEAECYQYTDLSANQKKKLMIADNKIFSLGIENLDTLNDFLVELQGDLEIPGFDEEILRQMVSDADEITEKISEYGTLDESEIRSIRESNEKREQKEAESSIGSPPGNTINTIPEQAFQEPEEQKAENEPPTEVQRFIECPKCGERIWL